MDVYRFLFHKEPDARGCVRIAPTSLEPIITILRMVFVRIRLGGVRVILLRGRRIRAAQVQASPNTKVIRISYADSGCVLVRLVLVNNQTLSTMSL